MMLRNNVDHLQNFWEQLAALGHGNKRAFSLLYFTWFSLSNVGIQTTFPSRPS